MTKSYGSGEPLSEPIEAYMRRPTFRSSSKKSLTRSMIHFSALLFAHVHINLWDITVTFNGNDLSKNYICNDFEIVKYSHHTPRHA